MKAATLGLLLLTGTAWSLDHEQWDALLKRHVNEESRVDYARLKANDLAALDEYVKGLAGKWPGVLSANGRKAALINAYNALTVQWILQHYPVESIWKTKKPFSVARHTVNASAISLDGIETELRKLGDMRIHSALVCAARSCPPLRKEAYVEDRINEQLDENTRDWLANPRLNEFRAPAREAEISMVFKWYRTDFPDLGRFLADHLPPGKGEFLNKPGFKVKYKTYHWGLNDTGSLGANYSTGVGFYLDYLRNR